MKRLFQSRYTVNLYIEELLKTFALHSKQLKELEADPNSPIIFEVMKTREQFYEGNETLSVNA